MTISELRDFVVYGHFFMMLKLQHVAAYTLSWTGKFI